MDRNFDELAAGQFDRRELLGRRELDRLVEDICASPADLGLILSKRGVESAD